MTPDALQAGLEKAAKLIKAKDKAGARTILRDLMQSSPQNPDVWYLASLVSTSPEQAIKMLERALSLNPAHPQARGRLAKLQTEAGFSPSVAAPKQTTARGKSRGRVPVLLIGVLVLAGIFVTAMLLRRQPSELAQITVTPPPSEANVLSASTSAGEITSEAATNTPTAETVSVINAETARKTFVGEQIAFFDNGALFLIDPNGGGQTPILRDFDFYFYNNYGLEMAWSPDGRHFAIGNFMSDETLTHLYDPSGAIRRMVGSSRYVSWSPSSDQLVMVWSEAENQPSRLYLASLDGTVPRPLPDSTLGATQPDWSGDGGKIAFVRSEDIYSIIFTINADGSDEKRVTIGSLPRWSPDGSMLLFERDRFLYRADADGSDEIQIAPLDLDPYNPPLYEWSPNGAYIAFVSGRRLIAKTSDGQTQLYASDEQRTIENFVWSPQSDHLLAMFDESLYIGDINGAGTHPFLQAYAEQNPSFSRQFKPIFAWLSAEQVAQMGTMLERSAEQMRENAPAQPYYFAASIDPIGVYRFDGENLEHLEGTAPMPPTPTPDASLVTATVTATPIANSQVFGEGMDWSPDGSQIAFSAFPVSSEVLFVANADGSNQRQLADFGTYPLWSPDGQQIAFLWNEGDGHRLYVVDAEGGEAVRVSENEPYHWYWQWSPDSTQIAYMAHGDLYIANADGSGERIIGRGYTPDWSADGQQILYTGLFDNGSTCVCIINSDGSGTPTQLVINGSFPTWSPDESQIAYVYADEIYVMNTDGSNQRRYTFGYSAMSRPGWSPDGLRIAYWQELKGAFGSASNYVLNVMDTDGGHKLEFAELAGNLNNEGGLSPIHWLPSGIGNVIANFSLVPLATPTPLPTVATLAPDRQPTASSTPFGGEALGGATGRILYRTSTINTTRYYRVDLHDRSSTLLPIPDNVLQIDFVRDGHSFVARAGDVYSAQLYMVDTEYFVLTPIPNTEGGFDPAISPDGSQVVYVAYDEKGIRQVWFINIDGTNKRQLTQYPDGEIEYLVEHPTWSSDGSRIAFGYYNLVLNLSEIHEINVNGSGERVLIERGTGPAWSPDGQQIAYSVSQGDFSYLYVADADGQNARAVTEGESAHDHSVSWSPNGRHLAFIRTEALFVVDVEGGNPTRLTDQAGLGDSVSAPLWEPAQSEPVATYTPVPTLTLTPSLTPSITPSLTPSLTPNPANAFTVPDLLTGRASAQMVSSEADPIGDGFDDAAGNIAVEGVAEVRNLIGALEIFIWLGEPMTSDFWVFRFYAPEMESGRSYPVTSRFPVRDLSHVGMTVSSPGRGCSGVGGDFIIEQVSPKIVVSFTHLCDGSPDHVISGTVTFTP